MRVISKKVQEFIRPGTAWLLALSLLVVAFVPFNQAHAGITSRKVTLGSSATSTATTYAFSFNLGTSTTVKSMTFEICSTTACSASPSGASVTGFTVNSLSGFGDTTPGNWTATTAAGPPIMAKIANNGNTGTQSGTETVTLGNITNTSSTNTTFFVRVTTYSGSGFTGQLDQGIVATSTAQVETVTATVNETLTFCVYDQGATCGSPGTGSVSLGTLTPSTTGTGTHQMEATTNAGSGYIITYVSPNSLKSGSNTISQIGSTATASSTNTQQFGLNLKSNTGTPNIANSADPSGGSGTATAPYATANSYAGQFDAAAHQVASASAATNKTTYTVSLIANIDGLVPPGSYSTTLTYVCTPQY